VRTVVGAPLRWATALAAVGVLGFAAGWFLHVDSRLPFGATEFPVFDATIPAGSDLPATAAAAPRRLPGTLREILTLRGDFAQSAALHVLAANSDRNGIERLLDEAEAVQRGSERRAASSILYQRFAELDPEAALEHMMRRESGVDSSWLYAVFYSWARTDLDGALAGAAKLDDRNRQTAGMAVVRSRDDLPPAEREALGPKMNVNVAVREASGQDLRSPKAAQRAWQAALAIGDRQTRQTEMFSVAHAWVQLDAQSAIRAIESLPNRGERDQLLRQAVESWAAAKPHDAVEWILARPPSHQRTELLGGVLGAYVMQDSSAAIAITERLSRVEQSQVITPVLVNWAATDPEKAAEWVQKRMSGEMQGRALMMIASNYVEQDPDAALRWASTLSGQQAQMVKSQLIQQIAHNDPERAGDMISGMDESQHRDSAVNTVATIWAQSDPRAALAWASRQAHSGSAGDLYAGVFGQWAMHDADAAMSQLNFIMDTDARNGAIRGIIDQAYLEPEALDRLLQRVEGAQARQLVAGQIYYRMMQVDPGAAERYRIEAGITEVARDGRMVVR